MDVIDEYDIEYKDYFDIDELSDKDNGIYYQ